MSNPNQPQATATLEFFPDLCPCLKTQQCKWAGWKSIRLARRSFFPADLACFKVTRQAHKSECSLTYFSVWYNYEKCKGHIIFE